MNETGIAGPRNVSVGLILIAMHITLGKLYKKVFLCLLEQMHITLGRLYRKYSFAC